jgi:polyhydroxyalkanoate synthesis regulator phasin
MRQDAWRSYLEMALGLTEASRKQATKAVKRALGKGAVTTDQLQGLAEELLKTSAANREAIAKLVRVELDRALSRVGLATAEEVGALNDRIRQLESELAAARVTAKSAPVAAAEPFGAADAAVVTTVDSGPAAAPGAAEPAAPRKKAVKKAVRRSVPDTAAAAPSPAESAPPAVPARKTATKAVKKTTTRKAVSSELSGAAPAAAKAPAKAPARKVAKKASAGTPGAAA